MRPLPRSVLFLSLALLAMPAANTLHAQVGGASLEAKALETKDGTLPYRLFRPKGREGLPADAKRPRLPLVVFLHGAGERGNDNEAQLRHGVADFVSPKSQAEHPCYLVAPQCPKKKQWNKNRQQRLLLKLIHSLREREAIDPDRIYLTGLSMGGYGTWAAASRHPELFAAALPICGGGDPERVGALVHLPLWNFHGTGDRRVPVERSREMLAALTEAGGRPRSTEYPGVGHDSWTRTYANREVHHWLFAQRKGRHRMQRKLVSGDRIVFFGDSITQAAVGPKGYITVMKQRLKKAAFDLQLELIGAGISGHRVPDLQKRIERDVLSKKPTIVIIYIGINDVWHWNHKRGTTKEDFENGLRELIAKLKAIGSEVLLCTPSVIGEKSDGSNALDGMLEEYAAISRKMADEARLPLIDLREHFIGHLKEVNGEQKERGILTTDGVHLNPAGNVFVAERMLEALGVH